VPRSPAPLDATIVSVRNVRRAFGDVVAVDDVSLEVPRGTILGVIGPSGSGKTTLVRMLTGTLRPTAGELRVLGQEPSRFTRYAREHIGYMPQHFSLSEELTASENVGFVASLFGLLWPRRRRRVREVLELVDLWDARGRRARFLSGGMQRRLELACALVHDPTLLFVDEPTAGLDPMLRQAIWAFEPRLNKNSIKVRLVADPLLMSHNALSFSIEAELWAQPIPLRLFLKTEIDLEDGNAIVVDAGSPG